LREVLGRRKLGMSHEREESVSVPIACTLTAAELAARRDGLLPGLLSRADAREPVSGGFRWRFDRPDDLLEEAAAVIDAEPGRSRGK
jgi:hypothetical protein